MNRMIDKEMLNIEGNGSGFEASQFAPLLKLGRKQGYVTLDDILDFFPEAERDLNSLEEAFAMLIEAGIPYVEDEEELEEIEDEAEAEGRTAGNDAEDHELEDQLANVDVNDLIGLYLKEAANVPLLTAKEEVELAQRIERGRKARNQLAKGKLSKKKRQELRRLIEDEQQAREHLISANSRLVVSIAKKYSGRGVPFIDLIQEGNIGLMRAAKKFNHELGYKFSTYATWWIRQAVMRAISNHSRTVRLPAYMGDKITKMNRAQQHLKQRLGREPTLEELGEELGMSPKRVEQIKRVARRPLSLEMPTDMEGDSVLGDFIEDEQVPAPDETATQNLMREHLDDLLEELPPREGRILQLRFGLAGGRPHTLREVGDKMGITRERVRQIETNALRRLRRPQVQQQLREYLKQS